MRDRMDRDQVEQYRTQECEPWLEWDEETGTWKLPPDQDGWVPAKVPVVRLHLKLIAMACGAAFTVLVFILLLEMFFG